MFEIISSIFSPRYPETIVYMLQSTEYRIWPFLRWYWRTNNFNRVAKRRQLERTKVTRLLLLILRLGIFLQIAGGAVVLGLGLNDKFAPGIGWGIGLLISYPVVWAHLIIFPTILGRWLIIVPGERKQIAQTRDILSKHSGIKIAVAGSYGKTSMKELLLTVLGAGKDVAATPANKNVASSHAQFARKLTGKEDVIIIEYGEGAPGDVNRFSLTTQPNIGVITGVAPAHLDRYKTIEAAGKDIFSLADYLRGEHVYVNDESKDAKPFIKPQYHLYSQKGLDDWNVKDVEISLEGTSYTLTEGDKDYRIKSGLLGRHQIGPLTAAVAIAEELGLTKKQIEAGISKTTPFEHRMEPRHLYGAWIVDDTYNGNIEGMRVGLEFLHELKAKRKIYVTPGLVDQGKEAEKVHWRLGELIAKSNPDKVVLIRNSAVEFIQAGMRQGGYKGEVVIEIDPLNFYTHLDQFIAAGDIVLMQNDWTDNYS